uniref:7TM GPCR serpentine receptor class x (Srx) domain-containing protein n=1 Tax=Panagrellus redivivus TaxID=6233 RepID=A0A7E4V0Q2_PANRE
MINKGSVERRSQIATLHVCELLGKVSSFLLVTKKKTIDDRRRFRTQTAIASHLGCAMYVMVEARSSKVVFNVFFVVLGGLSWAASQFAVDMTAEQTHLKNKQPQSVSNGNEGAYNTSPSEWDWLKLLRCTIKIKYCG